MKKLLMLMAVLAVSSCAFAQTEVLVGDMNKDGVLNEEDIRILANDLAHKHYRKIYSPFSSPFLLDEAVTHSWVDLGLPSGTLWATCNVGAAVPDSLGLCYAWGETTPRKFATGSWQTYAFSQDGTSSSNPLLTKYNTSESYGYGGFTDGRTVLEDMDDIAFMSWGSDWQMPSKQQIAELLENTNHETVTVDGVTTGFRLTSKVSGYTSRSVFFPVTKINLGAWGDVYTANYWSRSLTTTPSNAWTLESPGSLGLSQERMQPYYVRPVRYMVLVQCLTVKEMYERIQPYEILYPIVTISPDNATNQKLTVTSSADSIVAVGNNSGEITLTGGKTGTATVTFSTNDLSGQAVSYNVEVTNDYVCNDGDHTAVDLGLPSGTLWASHNVGRTSHYSLYSDFFAWGDPIPYYIKISYYLDLWRDGKSSGYSNGDYKYFHDTSNKITKYAMPGDKGVFPITFESGWCDSKTELEPEDDAATVHWGSDWQTPSIEQLQEVFDSRFTTIEWGVEGSVLRLKVTSKVPGFIGNSITFPIQGMYHDKQNNMSWQYCYTWSRSLDLEDNSDAKAYGFYINGSGTSISGGVKSVTRSTGLTVHAVKKAKMDRVHATSVALNKTSIDKMYPGHEVQLTATVSPSDATIQSVSWSSSNTSVAKVDGNGKVVGVKAGTATITATSDDTNAPTATCTVTIVDYTPQDTREYVDLGLPSGTMWATCNVGSTGPLNTGDYFAWGEVRPNLNLNYSWDTYAHAKGEGNLTKYCSDASFGYNGYTDEKTKLDAADDVATKNWGSGWYTPSEEQFAELFDTTKTTVTWTTAGILVQSKMPGYEDKYIVLPYTGFYDGSTKTEFSLVKAPNASSYYWCNALDTLSPNKAVGLQFSYSGKKANYIDAQRNQGFSVRPVRDIVRATEINSEPGWPVIYVGDTVVFHAITVPENTTRPAKFYHGNHNAVSLSEDGVAVGLAPGISWVRVVADDGQGDVWDENCVIVKEHDTMESVDLGLPSGTLWATCNIGAARPEVAGDYYAWGETDTYYPEGFVGEDDYWHTECVNGYYCDSYFDFMEGNGSAWANIYNFNGGYTELRDQDDVAIAKWGSEWEIPSLEQMEELVDTNYTTMEPVYKDGKYIGNRITSKIAGYTDKSIFLPAGGAYHKKNPLFDEGYGYWGSYWTSTLSNSLEYYYGSPNSFFAAKAMVFTNKLVTSLENNYTNLYYSIENECRWYGLNIRPVRVKNQ